MRRNKFFIGLFWMLIMISTMVIRVYATDETAKTSSFHLKDMIVRTAIAEGGVHTADELADYTVMHGDVSANSINKFTTYTSDKDLWKGTLGTSTDNVWTDGWKIETKGNDGLIAVITAKEDITVNVSATNLGGWTQTCQLNVYVKTGDNLVKHQEKDLSEFATDAEFNGKWSVAKDSTLYYEFVGQWDLRNVQEIHNIVFNLSTGNSGVEPDTPVDPPVVNPEIDWTTKTEIDLVNMAEYVVKNAGSAIVLKDMKANLLQGNVLTQVRPFANYITLGNGYLLSDTENFSGEQSAAFETWRMKTTNNSSAIYEFEATSDIKLSITHKAITQNSWIDEHGQYFGLYIKTPDGKIYNIWTKDIKSIPQDENAFAGEVMLKAGDICYYVFGSTIANERNVEFYPTFTSNVTDYNEDARNAQLTVQSVKVNMWDALTATINNEYNAVNYGLFDYGFYYGSVKNPTIFNFHVGDGTGTAEDALWDAIAGSGAGFQRWQMQCALDKDAIMIITAKEDIKLNLTTDTAIWPEVWSTFTEVRYYVEDIDGIRSFIHTVELVNNTDNHHFDYEVHLTKGQKFIVDYCTTTTEWGSINFAPTFSASTEDFDSSLVLDFTEIKALETLKQTKIQELEDLFYEYDEFNYSIDNYQKIDNLIIAAIESIEFATTETEVNDIVTATKKAIDELPTLSEEKAILDEHRVVVLAELEAYMKTISSKNYTEENYKSITDKYDSIKEQIANASSKTQIDTLFKNFQGFVNKVAVKENNGLFAGCNGSIISSCFGLITLLGSAILFKKKKEER